MSYLVNLLRRILLCGEPYETPSQPQARNPVRIPVEVNEQTESLLFQRLPQEIRDEIYCQLFRSTRLIFGGEKRIGPHHALAILSICRRARSEIGNSWLRHVPFHFETAVDMLDKLTLLADDVMHEIRHVFVRRATLVLSWQSFDVFYDLTAVLRLIPGLRLDRLTVLGGPIPQDCYRTVEGLIAHSDGWKELYYFRDDSQIFGYGARLGRSVLDLHDIPTSHPNVWLPKKCRRRPQPLYWRRVLERRDGEATESEVVIYRSKTSRGMFSVMDPAMREVFEQGVSADQDPDEYVDESDPTIMSSEERDKETLIVVKRGLGVDYETKKDPPLLDNDIRRGLPDCQTWREVRARFGYACYSLNYDRRQWAGEPASAIPRLTSAVEYHIWTGC